MKSKITLIAFVLAIVCSCKAKKEVTEKPVTPSESTEEVVTVLETTPKVLSPVEITPEIEKLAATYDVEKLYENNCFNCHKLYKPEDFSKEQWVPILKRMQKKARISDAETLAIFNYLTSQTN